MNENKNFLGTEPIGKLLLRLALPTVAAQMINMLYNIVDRIYIGHIPNVGALALTGVGVCMPLIMIVAAFAALVGNGGAPRASIFMGQRDTESAEKTLGNCFLTQLIISAILTIVLLIGNRTFLLSFGASENTIEYAVSYMNIYAIGTLFVQLTLGMNAFITAQGFAKTGMLSVLIGAVTNIILDLILVAGFHFRVGAAALATVISQCLSALLCFLHLLRGPKEYRIYLSKLRLDSLLLKQIISNGLPAGLQNSIISLANVVVQSNINKFGQMAVAGCGSYSKIEGFAFLPITCFALALTTFISQNLGAKEYDRAKKGAVFGVICSVVTSELVGVVIYTFAPYLIAAFNNTPDVLSYGVA